MAELNKSELSERDICTKYITPAVVAAGWDVMTQIREEVDFRNGQRRANRQFLTCTAD